MDERDRRRQITIPLVKRCKFLPVAKNVEIPNDVRFDY